MVKNKKKNWKVTAAKVYCSTPKKNGKVQWAEIARKISETHKDLFSGCSNPSKKLQDAFRSKEMKALVAEYETAAMTTEDKVKVKATKKIGEHSETEIYSTDIVEENVKNDGSSSKSIDVLLNGEMPPMTEKDWLELASCDPEKFKLVSATCRKGVWQSVSTEEGVVDLRSARVNVTVKPRLSTEVSLAQTERLLLELIDSKASMTTAPAAKVEEDADKIAILSIADLHLGKLAWAPECGESYDHKIATKRFNHIVNTGISRLAKEEGIEKIIFFWSQDFFHFDTPDVTTTAGTRQDTDVRWQKMFDYGTKMLVEAIEKLRHIAPVHTFYVRSNHDTQTSYYAASLLSAYFHSYKDVTVDTGASPRKYIQYGCNLFGFGHGDKEGNRIGHLMPIEKPVEWGQTWNHEFFLGHFHCLRTKEDSGVILRYLSSPTGTDAWHCEEGFLGAQKAAQLFIRGKHDGIIAEYTINVK